MRRCEGPLRAVGALLLVAIGASPASANTRSQQIFAQALIPFHAERWEAARQLLDEAATADPDDAVVAYYRGLTNARLGAPDNAITDIERALALRPDLPPAVLDLGILYFETGQYDAAQQWLLRAHSQPATRFSAALFLGLTKLRLGDATGAQPLFAQAAKDPALRQTAQYYQAVAQIRAGEVSAGRELLSQVETGPADLETTQVARQYLTTAPAVTGSLLAPPWSAYGDAGFGYDSNVTLTPDKVSVAGQAPGQNIVNCYTGGGSTGMPCQKLDTKGEQDGFFAIALGGSYRLFAINQAQATIGYDFYQSVHFETPSFDLQNHRIHLDLSSARYGFIQFGVSGFYDFYLLDYASFYQQGRGVPWLTFFEGNIAATQVYYQIVGQDYLGSRNSPSTNPGYSLRDPFNPFRDNVNNGVGARQFFLLGAPNRFMSFGYQWDYNDPLSRNGADFAYYENIIDARVDFDVLDWAHGTIGYAVDFQNYRYKNSRTDFFLHRHDADNQIVVRFAHDFTSYLSVNLGYYAVFNPSNIPDFEYSRNIVEAAVRVHF